MIVVRNGKLVNVDEEKIYYESNIVANKFNQNS
jgi:hypothetical protein